MESKIFLRFTRLVWISSFVSILTTVLVSSIMWESFKKTCICNINNLAYSWEAFGLATLISTLLLSLEEFCKTEKTSNVVKALFIVQNISFVVGIFFLIYFGCKITDVI